MSERSYDMDKMLDRLDALEQRMHYVSDHLTCVAQHFDRETIDVKERLERAERAAFNGAGLPPEQLEKVVYQIANKAVSKRTGGLEVQADLSARLAELEAVCAKLKHLLNAPSALATFDGTIGWAGGFIEIPTKCAQQGLYQDCEAADCAKHIPGSDASASLRESVRGFGGWHLEGNKVVPNEGPLIAELEELRRERDGWHAEASLHSQGFNALYGFLEYAFEQDWFQTATEPSVIEILDQWGSLAKRPQPVVHSSCKEALATEPVTASPAVTKEPQTSDNSNPTT